MKNWFKRLFDGKGSPAPAPAVPAPPVRLSSSSEQAAPVPGVRRPLVAANGDVAGFEFTLAASIEDRLRRRADPVAHAAHAISLMLAMRPAVEAEQIALASEAFAKAANGAAAKKVIVVPGRLVNVVV